MTTKFSLMIARFPGGQSEHPDSSGYVMKLLMQLPSIPTVGRLETFRHSDTPIDMVRNLAVKSAKEKKVDYLLMIDNDLSPDLYLGADPTAKPFFQSSWEFLMERRRWEEEQKPATEKMVAPCAIAAPYCGPPPHENIYVFRWRNYGSDHPNPDFRLDQYTREEAAILGGIQEAAALPTGLIIYDMRIFDRLDPPWFAYEFADAPYNTQKASTEDVYQTRNQSMLGMPCYCNWDAWAGHIKLKTVGKPQTLTVDDVQKQLADAVLRGHRRNEKLIHVNAGGITGVSGTTD